MARALNPRENRVGKRKVTGISLQLINQRC